MSAQGWRPSAYVGGSPGKSDAGQIPNPGDIIINEVLSHSHDEASDWIELHNTTDASIDISGWFLSDSDKGDPNMMKFEIAAGTSIAANGHKVFYQSTHFGNASANKPFALSENGETVYLRSALDDDDNFTGHATKQKLDAAVTNVAFARHVNSDGSDDFVATSDETPGSANDPPKQSPVIITEIMYEPPMGRYYDNDEFEYIELTNTSGSVLWLATLDNELNDYLPLRFTNGIDFIFPPGTFMATNERILIVKNIDAFDSRYTVPDDTRIFQWDSGKLNNDGEKLQLSQYGDQLEGIRYYIRWDSVNYNDAAPWPIIENRLPTMIDVLGKSLQLISPNDEQNNYRNDPANWKAATPTPGS